MRCKMFVYLLNTGGDNHLPSGEHAHLRPILYKIKYICIIYILQYIYVGISYLIYIENNTNKTNKNKIMYSSFSIPI